MTTRPGLYARYVALCFQVARRLKKDRCPGCGERPMPFNFLCERCYAALEAKLQQHRKP